VPEERIGGCPEKKKGRKGSKKGGRKKKEEKKSHIALSFLFSFPLLFFPQFRHSRPSIV